MMEERAVELVGAKQQAANLLYGETGGGGLSALSGGGGASLLGELAAAIDQDASVVDLRALFAEHAQQAGVETESAWYAAEDEAGDASVVESPTLPTAPARPCALPPAATPQPPLLPLATLRATLEAEPAMPVPSWPTYGDAPALIPVPAHQLGLVEVAASSPTEPQAASAPAQPLVGQQLSLF